MMTDTQITRPAESYHPEMTRRCAVRLAPARKKVARTSRGFFPGIPTIPTHLLCGIPAILQHPQKTPLRYPYDTPTWSPRYPVDTHLLESQDDVGTAASTGGAKPSKLSEARAGLRSDRLTDPECRSAKQEKAPSEIFWPSLSLFGPDAMMQSTLPGLPEPISPPTKRCTHCFQRKALGAFSADASRLDGLCRLCRDCDAARNRKRWRDNAERMRARQRQRYAVNLIENRERGAERRRSEKGRATKGQSKQQANNKQKWANFQP